MFSQMQYFIAVVDQHNFTRAAEQCHISQSAISQQIKELETTIGVQLLDRHGRSFDVTPAGQYFYQHAQAIVQQTNQLVEETQKLAQEQKERYVLRLGYLANFGTQEFLQAVAQFSKQYPDVRVQITSGMHEKLFELLRTDQIDLDFADQRRALSDEYQNEFLTETEFTVVVPQGRYLDKQKLTTAELADLPCILVVGTAQEAQEEQYYRDVLGVQSSFLTATTFDEAQMMVAAGQGYLIANGRTQGQVNQQINQVLPLYNGEMPLHQSYYAYWKQDNSGYYIESFAQILKEQFKS
ncbi:LysR family transcriptional regulator [Limosilactobacillus caecicola]|uniref:LysR family transcriptional regulator n=1 Tax=Limosilactobacillus caecicola TaxID=2941332 RepID=UPI0020408F4C|nr:LysR family transcriptional regulator [Limosilactobacillus caecicola]